MEIIYDVQTLISTTTNPTARYNKIKGDFYGYIDQGVTKVTFSSPTPNNNILELTLPLDSLNRNPIRLVPHVDFNNWTIKIKNNSGLVSLFEYEKKSEVTYHDTYITKDQIDSGDFSNAPELASGKRLLFVTDVKEWTYRTDSANTIPYFRSDIILIENGKALNKPIAPYNTPSTVITYEYYKLDSDLPAIFENVKIIRDTSSTSITNIFSVLGYDNVTFKNINVAFSNNENPSTLTNDYAFTISRSSNIKFEDVTVNNTYSKYNVAGYAFFMQAVYNSFFKDVSACGNWGVFGTHYLNRVYLEGCTLNRFDIHCYGRDVKCINCTFRNDLTYQNNGVTLNNPNRYNQLSSFWGTIHFVSCNFINFFPLLLDPSFHTYTGFDFIMENCTLTPNPENTIIKVGNIESGDGKRTELKKMCWPNIQIINLTLQNFTAGTNLLIFKTTSTESEIAANSIGFISEVSVSLASSYGVNFLFANSPNIKVENAINFKSSSDSIIISNLPSQI